MSVISAEAAEKCGVRQNRKPFFLVFAKNNLRVYYIGGQADAARRGAVICPDKLKNYG